MNNESKNKKILNDHEDVSSYTLHGNKKNENDDLKLSNLYQADFDDEYDEPKKAEHKRKQKIKLILNDSIVENKTETQVSQNKTSSIAKNGMDFLELINSKATRKDLPKPKVNSLDALHKSEIDEQVDAHTSINNLNKQLVSNDLTQTNKINKKNIQSKLKFNEFDNKPKSLDDYFEEENDNLETKIIESKQNKKTNKTNKKQIWFRNNFDLTKDYSKEVGTLKSKIDSILHVAGENGVSAHDLQRACEIDREHLKIVLNELKKQYESLDSGIILVEFGEKFKVLTINKNKDTISRFVTTTQKNPLNQSAFETLAIIAYNKSATRGFIEKIRDKDPKSAIDTLLKYGLIKQAGFAKGPGRAILYTVTQTFFDKFGIQDFADLPTLNKEIPYIEIDETE